jgi:hypothetical protein
MKKIACHVLIFHSVNTVLAAPYTKPGGLSIHVRLMVSLFGML